MLLCLDIGNTTIHAGVYDDRSSSDLASIPLKMQFRRTSEFRASSDEIGVFMRSALRENGIQPEAITRIALCSVVPDAVYSIRGACQKYFGIQPFILKSGVKTGLNIKYRNPLEVGADRIANSIAGIHLFPGRNLIIVDFGTATTFCAITKEREYMGGVILAGIRISAEALEQRTAKLPSVEVIPMTQCLGRSTVESIQSGLYYGQIGMVREIASRLQNECFAPRQDVSDAVPLLIGTGGFSGLFEKENLFHHVIPDLVLRGMLLATHLNQDTI